MDVQGYGGRTNPDQLTVRRGLFEALSEALAGSGVPEVSFESEDRGDGALIIVHPDVPKERLAGPFPPKLAAALERHNGSAPPGARIKIRVALHAGEVLYDAHGVTGSAIVTACRLLDADPLKDALRDSPGAVGLIASDWFYQEVVRQCPTCDADTYRPVAVSVKETHTRGWIRLVGCRTAPTRVHRLLSLHPGAEISVPAAAALLDVPADETGVILRDLRLEECAEGRFRVPALDDGLTGAERTDALRRVLAWYLGTADNARRILCPDRITATLTLPDAPGLPLTFTSADEARGWCEAERLNLIAAARAAADEGQHDIAWRLPLALWTFFFLRSPWTDWIESLGDGLASAEHLDDDRGIAYALAGLGHASQHRWNFEESIDLFGAARDIFVRIGDRSGEGWALHGLGYACRRLQRFREAVVHHGRSLRLAREAGERPSTGMALTALGYAHAGLNEFTTSLGYFEQAHAIAADPHAEGWALHGLGYSRAGQGDFDAAIVHYRKALDAFREARDRPGQGETLYNLGRAHLHMGRHGAARHCWISALAIFEDLQTPQTAGVLARLRSLDPRS
ncbi:tetratricopeptide repeat protein [Actinomadura sp. 7K507]|uniref:tetratricopeptide repeat protein n=1 Tax=Actinomadura sp. 7K507 TaxID=2530365 RepID=UPI001044B3FB|nr:tetratricopeptide repeat protein [Actinomadura sp. 7K507]TDC81972.1 tetratricopeptide repeat protein [Actinomadura sp. 7K507]